MLAQDIAVDLRLEHRFARAACHARAQRGRGDLDHAVECERFKAAAEARTELLCLRGKGRGAVIRVAVESNNFRELRDLLRRAPALKGEEHIREYSQGYKKTTNNRMELMAAIVGLEALNRPCEVELYSDSKYLVDAFNQHWIDSWLKKNWKRGKNEDVKNVDLWKRLLKAKEQHQVSFHWVKGHADNPLNERCDQLATSAADGNDLYVDEGINGLQK